MCRYVDDAGDMDAPDGMSYADWEAQQAVNVQIPAWMEAVLRIPGGGICLLIILLPLTLVRALRQHCACSREKYSDALSFKRVLVSCGEGWLYTLQALPYCIYSNAAYGAGPLLRLCLITCN